jgi:hypothetical protein
VESRLLFENKAVHEGRVVKSNWNDENTMEDGIVKKNWMDEREVQ